MSLREPRGDCYVHTAEWMMRWGEVFGEEGALPENAKLVQGSPTLRVAPYEKYGHAWIEVGDTVLDPTFQPVSRMAKTIYYALGKIDYLENRSYDQGEVRAALLEAKHYGPWREGE